MAPIPNKIINRPLQFLHSILIMAGVFFGVIAVVAFNEGGNFIGPGFFAALLIFLGSKIKYQWDHKASLYK
ncbi:MAG: hypothetical protein AAFV45_12705 [Pseudomonadota bacterium]